MRFLYEITEKSQFSENAKYPNARVHSNAYQKFPQRLPDSSPKHPQCVSIASPMCPQCVPNGSFKTSQNAEEFLQNAENKIDS